MSKITAKKETNITGKLSKANELKIPIFTKQEFIEKFEYETGNTADSTCQNTC